MKTKLVVLVLCFFSCTTKEEVNMVNESSDQIMNCVDLSSSLFPDFVWMLEGNQEDYYNPMEEGGYFDFGDDWLVNLSCPDGTLKIHNGWDIRRRDDLIAGKEVYSTFRGVVVAVGQLEVNWGDYVIIEHTKENNEKFTTSYLHIDPVVSVGNVIETGQMIGKITFLEQTPHLHFSIRNHYYDNIDPDLNTRISSKGALPPKIYGNECEWCLLPVFPEHFYDPAEITYLPREKILEGNVTLKNQEEVNAFGNEGYTKIIGSLVIGNQPETTNIVNLAPLNRLKSVSWLGIIHNDYLVNLAGLHNIEEVKQFVLRDNLLISDLSSISKITEVEGQLQIINNPALLSLNGLENIVRIGTSLEIVNNDSVTNLNDLININSSFGGYPRVVIAKNSSLSNLNGLNNISSIGELIIKDNSNLESLIGLDNLNEIYSLFRIDNNNSLNNLQGLSFIAFTSSNTTKTLEIINNDSMTSLIGIEGMSNISKLKVQGNSSLNDFCDFLINSQSQGLNYIINNNAFNPSLDDLINGNCSS